MMLQPITTIRDDASSKIVALYDANGQVVGAWCKCNGRAMLGDAFYVREDANTGSEREYNNERDYAQAGLSKRVADTTDHIDCKTYYQTSGNSTRQSVASII